MPQVDYRGEEVNVHNFLLVLTGALARMGLSTQSLCCCCIPKAELALLL